VALAGLLLAALAESSSVALLGLSGWFIASCAVAGAATFSTFSYIAPSGGVRSLALLRIGSGYGERLVQHAAVLSRLGAIRLGFFGRAAERRTERIRPVRDGELLDQAMNDTETESMSLITVISPLVSCVVVGGASIAVAALASPLAGGALGVAGVVAVVVSLLAAAAQAGKDDEDRARRAVRGELITALDAWPELASLGAADRLVRRSSALLTRFAGQQASVRLKASRAGARTGVVAVAGLAVASLATVADHRDAATVALVLLLGIGLFGLTARTSTAFGSLALVRAARARRVAYAEGDTGEVDSLPRMNALLDDSGLQFADYLLPQNAIRSRDRVVIGAAPRGSAVVVTGVSGSGKTTFLQSLDRALLGKGRVVRVAVDDHIFTGTVGTNLRLGDPAADEERLREVLSAFQLDRAGLVPTTSVGAGGRALSGGEQTRLRLARAVLAAPEVLIADEPTSGLDEETAHAILRALMEWLPHAVLVLSLHRPDAPSLQLLGGAQVIRFD
jgi:ATP-binding cassette subfamily C protein CydC